MGQRETAEQQARFEKENAGLIEEWIAGRLGCFAGAEDAGSEAGRALQRRIRGLAGSGALRTILAERLRDYQIRGAGGVESGEAVPARYRSRLSIHCSASR